jgi:hypothetical protein
MVNEKTGSKMSQSNGEQNNGVIPDHFPGGKQQPLPVEPEHPEGLFINIRNCFEFYQIFSVNA